MGWIVALIVGGIAGWLAGAIARQGGTRALVWNIVVGCAGSVAGNALARPIFGIEGDVQQFSATGLAIAAIGAAGLLGLARLAGRGRSR